MAIIFNLPRKTGASSNPIEPTEPKEPVLKPSAPPWEAQATTNYTILDALREFTDKQGKATLMLIRVASGEAYQVIRHDPDTKRTHLVGPAGGAMRVVLSKREVPLYTPFWRT